MSTGDRNARYAETSEAAELFRLPGGRYRIHHISSILMKTSILFTAGLASAAMLYATVSDSATV